ncbi:Hsp70 family protein [Glycomyces luteolus]|uniref:Hsp70 family protein n=1 Tax=Glycomyces luteolus TaxID=2670330 RepID=A0A9X3SU12_9ACTN|nr:Hsp70 family protein [Glycomyces luteolus]MDA1360838.1 Hsp70 family protein [Glycomyces luteolus]
MHNVPPAASVRIDPGAAAASLSSATGGSLASGAAFAVYRLGRSSFHAAVVRRIDNHHVVVAERTEPIGGAEFDGLLLAYLSGRHPDAGVRLWSRIADPAEAADRQLRALLLEKITQAREQLSERDFTVINVTAADIKMPLRREEFETRVHELVDTTADVLEEVLVEAGVHPAELAGLLMAGGASRTPLAATTLRRRFGVEPVLAAPHAKVLVAEAAPVATRELPLVDEEEPAPRRKGQGRAVVLAAALLVVVGAGAAFGSQLGDSDSTEDEVSATGGTASATTASPAASASPEASESPAEEASASPSESPTPDEDEQGPEAPVEDEAPSEEDPTTESAPTGSVPNLVGLSTADALRAVEEAGFEGMEQSGEARAVFDWSHEDCEVIEQSPVAGSTRALSETISVTFSYSGEESECDV